MIPPAELIDRVLGKSRLITLYYGEPAKDPKSIALLHSLEALEFRRLDKRIRPSRFDGAKPVLVLNYNLRFESGLAPRGLVRNLGKLEAPTFSHKACYATSEMNQFIHRRLAGILGQHEGLVGYQHDRGVCVFYPVNLGDRLVVAYFAI